MQNENLLQTELVLVEGVINVQNLFDLWIDSSKKPDGMYFHKQLATGTKFFHCVTQ
jgi:hypothetical protein